MDKKELLKKRSVKNDDRYIEVIVLDEDLKIKVRALTRAEVKECTGRDIKSIKDVDKIDRTDAENKMIAMAMVDPEMSVSDVVEWLRDAPSGDSVKVLDAVSRLSGLADGAPKSSVPSNGKRP